MTWFSDLLSALWDMLWPLLALAGGLVLVIVLVVLGRRAEKKRKRV